MRNSRGFPQNLNTHSSKIRKLKDTNIDFDYYHRKTKHLNSLKFNR